MWRYVNMRELNAKILVMSLVFGAIYTIASEDEWSYILSIMVIVFNALYT